MTCLSVLNIAVSMANSVDPDQRPQSVASDLGLHCLQRSTVPILRVITVPSVCSLLNLPRGW